MKVGVAAKRFGDLCFCLNPASCVLPLQFLSCAEARPTHWASDFARTLKASEPYPIVSVRHRYQSPGFTIWVFPVARPLKSIAREAFLSSGLEACRQLILLGAAAPHERSFCEAVFDPIVRTCTINPSPGKT